MKIKDEDMQLLHVSELLRAALHPWVLSYSSVMWLKLKLLYIQSIRYRSFGSWVCFWCVNKRKADMGYCQKHWNMNLGKPWLKICRFWLKYMQQHADIVGDSSCLLAPRGTKDRLTLQELRNLMQDFNIMSFICNKIFILEWRREKKVSKYIACPLDFWLHATSQNNIWPSAEN